ncbi:molybdate transport system substrate-binding protein [Salinibacillus kushneri]|uniref:Molybdate transport system substrate-binding protein n=1 Tax=Salinibacillus kushneri TaxID=237682 RepID=A0A1I0DL53_9BACI|nr:molybdate ABC transporter substrate-binding protein [Salinibacillus kushneri]SET33229.1 molybdate transport system substrate-binding protein [Salinibacillus kushneri]
MKRLMLTIFTSIVIITGCSAENKADKTEITVSAASSMTDCLQELKNAFENEYPSIKIHYNFGGSGSLRRQIEQEAPIDLFFSASERDYQKVMDKDFVKKGDYLFGNSLVLIKSDQTSVNSIEELLKQDGKMAIGTPESVPAGTYAKEALKSWGKWNELKATLVYTKDVAQVLTLVNEGAADLGIVYNSDMKRAKNVTVLKAIDADLHTSIGYYLAVIKDQLPKEEEIVQAKDTFYKFALSDTAKEVYKKYGFTVEK